MKIDLQLFGGRGQNSQGKRANKTQIKPNTPSLGTINGEQIRSFTLYGEESGEVGEYKSLKELYEAMQDIKSFDRKEMGYTDDFSVQINTDKNVYTDYRISKYKGRYKLK